MKEEHANKYLRFLPTLKSSCVYSGDMTIVSKPLLFKQAYNDLVLNFLTKTNSANQTIFVQHVLAKCEVRHSRYRECRS